MILLIPKQRCLLRSRGYDSDTYPPYQNSSIQTMRIFLMKISNIILNPTGVFVIGGPHGDTGLTGRKIIVDTYGGKGAHGGGLLRERS